MKKMQQKIKPGFLETEEEMHEMNGNPGEETLSYQSFNKVCHP